MVGLARGDAAVTDTAFDILSVEALFLVPRYVRTRQRAMKRMGASSSYQREWLAYIRSSSTPVAVNLRGQTACLGCPVR